MGAEYAWLCVGGVVLCAGLDRLLALWRHELNGVVICLLRLRWLRGKDAVAGRLCGRMHMARVRVRDTGGPRRMATYVLVYKGGGAMPATDEERNAELARW